MEASKGQNSMETGERLSLSTVHYLLNEQTMVVQDENT